ncbi:MAG TPA: hypothetical protein VGH58_05405 [Solirubrobacterales bacterium]
MSYSPRAQALTLIAEGTACSPAALAGALGLDVRHVAYHVRVLHKLGCIELVDARQRRGAVEHLYGAVDRASDEG